MEYRILGPLEIADDGRPLVLNARKQRALLLCLLLARERGRLGRRAGRRGLGRAATGVRREARAGLRLPAAAQRSATPRSRRVRRVT